MNMNLRNCEYVNYVIEPEHVVCDSKYRINKNKDYYFEVGTTGIGDRMGQILTICTFGKCFELNTSIVLIWRNSSHRHYDLDTIKRYISFPSNCIITEDESLMENRDPLYLNSNVKTVGHSYDLIPEPSYKLLLENYELRTHISFEDYLTMYINTSSELTISDSILMGNKLPVDEYKCVHVRRDDKLLWMEQPFIPPNLIQQINNEEDTIFLFISDDIVPEYITNKKKRIENYPNIPAKTIANITNWCRNRIVDIIMNKKK